MRVDVPDMIGPSEAARLLGVSKRHVLRLADDGKLAITMTPLGRLLSRAGVVRLANERKSK